MAEAASALLAPRVETTEVWKESGEPSCASYLAGLEGVSKGQARSTLEVGRALTELPLCEKAAREGSLSRPKLVELTSTLISDPSSERTLLSGAATEPLQATKERCQRARATDGKRDPVATLRRIRAGRHLTWWSDSEGAFCFQGRDTADRGAVIRNRLEQIADSLRRERARSSATDEGVTREPDGALRADALFTLLSDGVLKEASDARDTSDQTSETSNIGPRKGTRGRSMTDRIGRSSARARDAQGLDSHHPLMHRPPRCNVIVRVDLAALLRGRTQRGECCEIDGQGPIPALMARDLANDSVLRIVFHRAGDIKAVTSLGRTIKRQLRLALVARDRCCVVPGCGVTSGLEIDHVVPFSQGGPTELDNLALLCHHHHFLKTFDGWVLTRAPGSTRDGPCKWSFEPPPVFGQEPDLGIDTPEGRERWRRQQKEDRHRHS